MSFVLPLLSLSPFQIIFTVCSLLLQHCQIIGRLERAHTCLVALGFADGLHPFPLVFARELSRGFSYHISSYLYHMVICVLPTFK